MHCFYVQDMKLYKFIFSVFVIISFFSCNYKDQESNLSKITKNIESFDDTLRYKAFDSIAKYYLYDNPKRSIEFSQKSLEIAQSTNDKKKIGKSYFMIAYAYDNLTLFNISLENYEEAFNSFKEAGDSVGMADALINSGAIYKAWGNYDVALKLFISASNIYEALDNKEGMAFTENNIGVIYYRLKEYDSALIHYQNALKVSIADKDSVTPGYTCNNIGLIYLEKADYKNALEYFKKALEIGITHGDSSDIVTEMNNIGLTYMNMGNYTEALRYCNKSLQQSQKSKNKVGLVQCYKGLSEVYHKMGNDSSSIRYCNLCLNSAKEIKFKQSIADSYLRLSEIYASEKIFDKAYQFQSMYLVYNDSIFNEEKQKQLSQLQTSYESDKKEKRIKILQQKQEIQDISIRKQQLQRNGLIVILILAAGFVFVIVKSLRKQRRNNYLIRIEQTKTDLLLLNILPASVAKDLKEKGKTEPRNFNNVTVFFSDFVGFTDISAGLDPSSIISELNEMFTAFDDIMSRHNCERIKTIGDAYMALCGVPEPDSNHSENILNASLEIIEYLKNKNKNCDLQWKARIGVHSGQVVGGVVGVRKYIFDVFGDTVNTASRMETNSEAMRVNVSEATYDIVKGKYNFIERDSIEVKGKGMMKMYFLEPVKKMNV